jgi:hypothetical protein
VIQTDFCKASEVGFWMLVMGKDNKAKRTCWLHVRLTPAEAAKINKNFERTTCREMSAYVRKRVLEQPVTYYTRNHSIDSGLRELAKLRRELNAVGNNFNQLVKKLNSFDRAPGLVMLSGGYAMIKKDVDRKIGEIHLRINQLAGQWLQESAAGKTSAEH